MLIGTGTKGYAVSTGVISLVLTVVYMIQLKLELDSIVEGCNRYFALFMWLWWTLAALILTMGSPFSELSNGYFASWAGFVLSSGKISVELQWECMAMSFHCTRLC